MLAATLGLLLLSQTPQSCDLAERGNAIVLNQTGFETHGPALAILRAGTDQPVAWQLVDAEGDVVLDGWSRPMGVDDSAGEAVHQIELDVTSMTGEGFHITACATRSRAFAIGSPPYADLSEDSLRYFYLNRLGTDLTPEFTGGDAWARAAGFTEPRAGCFAGMDREGTDWPGCAYTLPVRGGWADAGDYGQYVVNGGIAVWTLQYAFERLATQDRLAATGWDGHRLSLPHRRPGLSEILLEARWQLEFMLGLQIPDGERVWVDARAPGDAQASLLEIEGGGLVHHKLHERAWLPLPLLPADADQPRYLYPPTTAATLNLAAVAAQCSRVWRDQDASFADRCLEAAERAFAAATRHPHLLARDIFDGGGGYGDLTVDDEFFWAATELYLATGAARYRIAADAHRPDGEAFRPIFWANTEALGVLSASLVDPSPSRRMAARTQIIETAHRYADAMADTAYHYPLTPDEITWGSNANLLNRALVMAAAHDAEPEAGHRDGVVHAMDYLLGRNPLDQSYIAGYGARPMRHPHHRFWARGADPEFPEAPPGALSGGPNARIMTDPVARAMAGRCAPQTCWADDVAAYALNEVAINWNAPLFAIAVFLDSTRPVQD